jgi:transposase-like protein
MAIKGQIFQSYTEEFKTAAVQAYLNGRDSYQVVAKRLGIRSCTQLKDGWRSGAMEKKLIRVKANRIH